MAMKKMTLKMLRVRDNLTQEEIAKKIGVSPETWSNWENKKTFPDIPKLQKIEEVFNVTYNDIIFLDNITV